MKRLHVDKLALKYMREVMDMRFPWTDQEQNWIWRHLCQFGARVEGRKCREVKTRAVKRTQPRRTT